MKIAFVYYGDSTFVEQDYNILSKYFEVRKVQFNGIESVYDIFKAVRWADMSFSWFADVWAFFAVLFSDFFGRKSLVVVGGYDVACERGICYGMCIKPHWRRWMRNYVLNECTFLLPVSENIKQDCYKYLRRSRDVFVVNTGYDSEKFKPDVNLLKSNVLTVVSGRDDIIKLKGLDTFADAARHFKDVMFIIVGMSEDRKKLKKPDNVFIVDKRSQKELIDYYQHAKVYCQLSLREGLPNALCEAMLCGCVPVGSDCDGVKNVIGDTGFCVPYGDVGKTANAIKEALKSDKGKKAREKIKNNFPIERREKELVKNIRRITI